MARLILEEGGQTRRFRLGEGKLSIGSGEGANLKLHSDSVADLHAELVVEKGTAILRMKKGVMPARIKGRSVTGEETLAHGVPVQLGDATLTVEYEEQAQGGLVARRNVQTKAERTGARQARVQRQRRQVQRSAPTWLILLLVGMGAVGAVYALKAITEDTGAEGFSAAASFHRIERLLGESDIFAAEKELEKVDRHADELTERDAEAFDRLRAEIEERRAAAELLARNVHGTVYLNQQLKKFEDEYLRKNEPPKVRVFLKRCRYFRKNWPEHPEMDWVRRMEDRYGRIVDLSDPPSFEDVEFEVESLTWAKPREYRRAFKVLEDFIEGASAGDKARALELLDAKTVEQDEHFTDRMLQAKWHWEQGQEGESVRELVSIVTRFADEAKEDEAARTLVDIEGIDVWLSGYKTEQPERFELLVDNDIVAEKAAELGLL